MAYYECNESKKNIGLIEIITTGTGNISGSIPDETKIILVTGTYGSRHLYEVPILCDSKSSGTSVGTGLSGSFNSNGSWAGAGSQITYDHATKTYTGYANPNYGAFTIKCYGYI